MFVAFWGSLSFIAAHPIMPPTIPKSNGAMYQSSDTGTVVAIGWGTGTIVAFGWGTGNLLTPHLGHISAFASTWAPQLAQYLVFALIWAPQLAQYLVFALIWAPQLAQYLGGPSLIGFSMIFAFTFLFCARGDSIIHYWDSYLTSIWRLMKETISSKLLFEKLDLTSIQSILRKNLHKEGQGRPVEYNPEWDLRALLLRLLSKSINPNLCS